MLANFESWLCNLQTFQYGYRYALMCAKFKISGVQLLSFTVWCLVDCSGIKKKQYRYIEKKYRSFFGYFFSVIYSVACYDS